MNKNNFKVLRGGLLDSASTSRKEFVSAYVTNTRLMGVVGMHIHFRLPENQTLKDLHQFFYFDAEEYGFDNYKSFLGDHPLRIREIENSMIGGLGGDKVSLTLQEAEYLLQEYVRFNRQRNCPLPEGLSEYGFLLAKDIALSEPDRCILMRKQCKKTESPFETINYFLMRVFGRDFSAAAFLSAGELHMDLFPEYAAGTFCKNTIRAGAGPDSYVCESLVELGNNYYIAVTSVTLTGLTVCDFQRISLLKVSPTEAAMTLSRSEFITVYEMLDAPDTFSTSSTRKSAAAMVTYHDTGVLYMIFHENNQHVAKQEYRLSADVFGMYYVTASGQLLAAAYSLEEIKQLEQDLADSPIGERLLPANRYEFQEAVLYEFIQSGFNDFNDFAEILRHEEEKQ